MIPLSKISFTVFPTHHIHNLLQGQAELKDHCLRFICHWTFQSFVVCHQVVDKSPFVRTTQNT